MSLSVAGKLLKGFGISALVWLALPAVSWAQQPGCATCPTPSFGVPCAAPCQTHHCPPAFKYCYEGAPRIHWTKGCPHPICNPCDLPHWGYFDTCWSPWPYPPTWGHCLTPPPAAYVNLQPMPHPNYPMGRPTFGMPPVTTTPNVTPMPMNPVEELPQPRRFDGQR